MLGFNKRYFMYYLLWKINDILVYQKTHVLASNITYYSTSIIYKQQ